MKKTFVAAIALGAVGFFAKPVEAAELPLDFMGIHLGQTFDMPECAASKSRFGSASYIFEWDQPTKPCWRHTFRDPGTPLDASDGEVQFYAARESSPAGVTLSQVLIVNGRVEGVRASTSGVKSQQSILAGLMKKYGTPSQLKDEEVQNRMGASFPSYTAEWGDADLQVRFYGVLGRVDSGLITVRTAAGQAYEEAKQQALEAAAPSF